MTVALVTGASRGIGKAILTQLAKDHTVIGTATSQKGADAISSSLSELGAKGSGLVLNVTDPASIESTLAAIKSDFGDPTILVNNAGATFDNLLLRMSEEEWLNAININLNAIFRMTKACLRPMIKAKWGRIVNISSVSGFIGNPGQSNYCAAKMGMVGFSKSLAREVASRNITVNLIAPGFIATDMTNALTDDQKQQILKEIPCGHMGSPDDIANVVSFLASDKANYITGETLHINGGMYMA